MDGFGKEAGRGPDKMALIDTPGVIGFISATALAFDSRDLTGQKADIDAAASTAGVAIDAYFVELAPRREGETWTSGVKDLLRLAHEGRLRGIVLERLERFAADRDDALLVAVTLAGLGVRIFEATRHAVDIGRAKRSRRRRGALPVPLEVAS